MAIVNLYPSATVSGNQNWTIQGGSDAHSNLADTSDSTGVRAYQINKYCVVELDNFTVSADSVTSIRWYVRGAYVNTRSGDTDVQVVLGKIGHAPVSGSADAYFSETFTLTFNAGYAPQDYYGTARTTDGSSAWDATSLNSLRLDINTTPEAPAVGGGPQEQARIWRAYVEVTYSPIATDNAVFFGTNF